MKVLHVTPSFYPATYWGGPIMSTLGLCDALADTQDVEIRVLTTDTSGPKTKDRLEGINYLTRLPAGYDVYYCRKTFGQEFSIEMLHRLVNMVKWADVVHLNYTYSPPTIPTLLACRLYGRPVVWSPRGALQRWEGTTRPIAKRAWEIVCNVLIQKKRTAIHVTSTEEAIASSKRIPEVEIAIIPNGVLIPQVDTNRAWKPENKLRIMYMGRLDPIKGINNLLEAMTLIKPHCNSLLAVYGDGDPEYRSFLEEKVIELGIQGLVTFHGPVSGNAKKEAFSSSDVCVVPSFTENFGMVVAEALASGIPVIAAKGTPWSKIEEKNCGMWIDNSPDSIASALMRISEQNLNEMGENGRRWMEQEYSWSHIADQMYHLYEGLAKNHQNINYR